MARADLAAYLPRIAVDWASDAPEERWRRVDGSLVFIDVSGFTALSERLATRGRIGAEELTEILGRCFTELLAVAYAEGGSLLKFGGDALLLLYVGDEHAARAARAALHMRETMRTVGQLTTSVGRVRLRMSAGVHSGPLDLFRVGRSHKELIITGPGATRTVEMEGTADGGEVLVSDATARAIDSRLLGDPKGEGVLLRRRTLDAVPETFPPRARVRADLTEAIPVALREHLVAGGGDSEHRSVVVGFVKFSETESLLEQSGEVLADALEELVGTVQAAAEEHGVTFLGTDIDRNGGKIILVAGTPRVLGDDDGRMLRTARAIADAGVTLPLRIGVNRGDVFSGEIGPPYRRTYTVMGDAVNVAARLMAAADKGEIFVSEEVLRLSRSAFEISELPPLRVKGKSEPLRAFALGATLGTQETRAAARLPFTGRGEEMAALRETLAEVRSGLGRVVEIRGDLGVGKSRVLQELLASVSELRRVVVTCEQFASATPYGAAADLLRQALTLPATPTLEQLRARMVAAAPELLPWLPLVADALRLDAPDTEATATLLPRFRRERTRVVVGQLLDAALGARAILAVEDAHWADDASAELVSHLCATIEPRGWLACVTTRDGSKVALPESAAIVRLALDPLPESDAEALIQAATADDPLPPHQRRALLERSGGNPLYIEELLEVLACGIDTLPSSIEAVVATQLDTLAPSDRRLLRHASVLGPVVDLDLLAEVSPEAATAAARPALRRLRTFLLAEGAGRFRFRHRLLRDVAYEGLPFNRRAELHARAGEALERRDAGSGDRAELLSMHFLKARLFDKGWRYGRLAGDRAAQKYANVEATELYERALTAARRVAEVKPDELAEVWERLGDVSNLAGFHDRAEQAFTQARRISSLDAASIARICAKQARLADRRGNATSAIRWIGRGLRMLDGHTDERAAAERASLWIMQAYARQQQGRPREALRLCQLALAEAQRFGNKRAIADAYMLLDWVYLDLGQPELATNGERALEILVELGELGEQAVLLNNLGGFAYYQGRWSDALDLYARAREAFERIGNVLEAALGTVNIAEILADQARLDEAEEALRGVLTLWRSLGFELGIAIANRHLARVLLRRGHAAEAAEVFTSARSSFATFGMSARVIEVDTWLAECRLRGGDPTGAIELIDDVLRRQEASGGTDMLPMAHRLRAYAYAAQGRLVDAWADLDASLAMARARNASFEVALTLEAFSVIASLRGEQWEESADQERRELLERLGVLETPPPPVTGGGEPVNVVAAL